MEREGSLEKMIECVSSKIFLFECHRCGVHIYSDRNYTQGCGCFFCGGRLMPILEVSQIPQEIKEENWKRVSWITKVWLFLNRLF